MKVCSECKQSKELGEFHVNKSKCRPCTAIYDRDKARTPDGLVRRIYNNQRMTTRKMGRPLPNYTFEQLCLWLDTQPEFHRLYHAWVRGGYVKDDSPSIDRLDNYQGYGLGNIQVVTWRQNLLNQKAQNISGKYLHTGSKAVRKLSIDGDPLEEFPSISIAARALGKTHAAVSNITAVAEGKWITAYGYKWEWA